MVAIQNMSAANRTINAMNAINATINAAANAANANEMSEETQNAIKNHINRNGPGNRNNLRTNDDWNRSVSQQPRQQQQQQQ